jgi:hypothetical protein
MQVAREVVAYRQFVSVLLVQQTSVLGAVGGQGGVHCRKPAVDVVQYHTVLRDRVEKQSGHAQATTTERSNTRPYLERSSDPRPLELLDEAIDVCDAAEMLLHGLSQLRIVHEDLDYVLPHL